MALVIGAALHHANEVITINFPMLDRSWMSLVTMVL
jgi:hypothetical protein